MARAVTCPYCVRLVHEGDASETRGKWVVHQFCQIQWTRQGRSHLREDGHMVYKDRVLTPKVADAMISLHMEHEREAWRQLA